MTRPFALSCIRLSPTPDDVNVHAHDHDKWRPAWARRLEEIHTGAQLSSLLLFAQCAVLLRERRRCRQGTTSSRRCLRRLQGSQARIRVLTPRTRRILVAMAQARRSWTCVQRRAAMCSAANRPSSASARRAHERELLTKRRHLRRTMPAPPVKVLLVNMQDPKEVSHAAHMPVSSGPLDGKHASRLTTLHIETQKRIDEECHGAQSYQATISWSQINMGIVQRRRHSQTVGRPRHTHAPPVEGAHYCGTAAWQ